MKFAIIFALLAIFGAALVESVLPPVVTPPAYCKLKPDGGKPCIPPQKFIRYFFNPLKNICSPFIYTG